MAEPEPAGGASNVQLPNNNHASFAPIHCAAFEGDLDEVQRLVAEDGRRLSARLEAAAVLDFMLDIEESTPLMLAAAEGHDAVVSWLLAQGADAGEQDGCDCAAAHYACFGGHPSTLALLLTRPRPAC